MTRSEAQQPGDPQAQLTELHARGARRRRITDAELDAMLVDYPPILTVREGARLLGISTSKLYRDLSQGRYRRAVVRRGNPTRLYRNLLVRAFADS